MRRISGLVLAAAVLIPASFARAADVTQIYTNNLFADANSFDPATGTTVSVSVTRVKGKGAPVDTLSAIVVGPAGFATIQGTLPKNALHITTKAASLEVDVADLTDVVNMGFPAQGVISVDWHAIGGERTSGGHLQKSGKMIFNFVGTDTFSDAEVSGTFFGADLVDPTGDIHLAHTSLHIHIGVE